MKSLLTLMFIMSSNLSFANAWLDRQHQYVQNCVIMAGTLLQTAEQHNRQCSGHWSNDKLMKKFIRSIVNSKSKTRKCMTRVSPPTKGK